MAARGRIERALAVVGAATVLVVGFDAITYAATGSSLLLGRTNTASSVTTIKNTGSGAALNLVTRSTASAPFTTNAHGLVKGLYAARAASTDALSSTALAQVRRSIGTVAFHAVGTAGEPGFASIPMVSSLGSWSNYPGFGAVGFRRSADGLVTLTGLACVYDNVGGTDKACAVRMSPGTGLMVVPVLTLPPGFRPSGRLIFPVVDTDRPARLDVLPDGEVQLQWSNGIDHSYVSLDGVSFQAGG